MTPDEVQRIAATARRLEAAAKAAGALVSGDGRVSEATAAQLLGIPVATLRRMRYRREIVAFHIGIGDRGRVSFRLEHLAALIELSAEPEAERFSPQLDETRQEVVATPDVSAASAASSQASARGGAARPASGNRPNAEPPPPAPQREES
jgi:hypothetical protein